MKILIISNVSGYSWAGSESLWHQAAMLALKAEYEVTGIVHPDLMQSAQISEFLQAGGNLKKWQALRIARFQSLKEKLAPTFSPHFLNEYNVILVSLGSLPAMNYVPGLVDGLLKTSSPLVVLCQFNADHLIVSLRERKSVAKVLEKATGSVFVSQRNLMEARRQFAMDPPKAHVIQNPIRNRSEITTPWPDESEGPCFASVARFEVAWKGQDLLLDVLSQPQWKDRQWRLRFYGEGPDREYLEKLALFYKISDRVFFEGQVKNLNQIWSKNHLLVMPSHGEGTPLAALEAMMAGRPVVATDVGGNTEIIQEGETGFIAEAATSRSFSKAMERAWDLRGQWKQMGESARRSLVQADEKDPAQELLDLCMSVAVTK